MNTSSSDLACLEAYREAFAAWLPLGGVPLSYAIAIGYVLVDTADKGVKAFQMAQQELGGNAALHPEVDTPKCATPRLLPEDVPEQCCLACSCCPGPFRIVLNGFMHVFMRILRRDACNLQVSACIACLPACSRAVDEGCL